MLLVTVMLLVLLDDLEKERREGLMLVLRGQGLVGCSFSGWRRVGSLEW